jgi:diaminopimelate decarboxylase
VHSFTHHDGRLWCEEVALDALAAEVGTPAYVYSKRTVLEHVRRLKAAFAEFDPLVCYALKANSTLALLDVVRREGVGFDVVSGGELRRVLSVGAKPSTVVFAGVGKTVDEMEEGLRAGILFFNVESEEELEVLAAVAARLRRRAGVAIRMNPDVDPKTHVYTSTGKKETKFGVDIERGEALCRRALALPSLELRGVQCHIGSQLTDVAPYREALEKTVALAARLRADAPALRWIDMGGGFGIWYRDEAAPPIDAYAAAVAPVLRGTGFRLAIEPGRVIVGNAGVLLTRVLYRKVSGDRRFVIVDAAMNDLIRPSLYGSYHRIWPVVGAPPPPLGTEPDLPPHDVVGPVCESGDFLAKDRPFPPETKAGDLLAVLSAGAYGFVMSSQYNSRPRAPEVVVDGARYAIARRRETYADLVRGETARPAFRVPRGSGGRAAARGAAPERRAGPEAPSEARRAGRGGGRRARATGARKAR